MYKPATRKGNKNIVNYFMQEYGTPGMLTFEPRISFDAVMRRWDCIHVVLEKRFCGGLLWSHLHLKGWLLDQLSYYQCLKNDSATLSSFAFIEQLKIERQWRDCYGLVDLISNPGKDKI